MEAIVIADDLTGAAEGAAAFAVAGFSAVVRLPLSQKIEGSARSSPQAQVFDTETRQEPSHGARRRLAEVLAEISEPLPALIYKKIDSTLRGSITAELSALMERFQAARLLVAPAFPAQGRTTLEGVQRVHGVPIDRTGVAAASSYLPAVLSELGQGVVEAVGLAAVDQGAAFLAERLEASFRGSRIVVVDAVTDLHLDTIAAAVFSLRQMPLLVGSAGLARALGRQMSPTRPVSAPPEAAPAVEIGFENSGVLVACGSRHSATLAQIEHLQKRLGPAIYALRAPFQERDRAALASSASSALRGRDVLLLAPTEAIEPGPGEAGGPSAWLGKVVAKICDLTPPAGLVLTGGETAFRAFQSMGVHELEVHDEIADGIPIGSLMHPRIGRLPVVTKAGGFGQSDALVDAVGAIRAMARPEAKKDGMSLGSRTHSTSRQGSDQ